MEPIKLKIKVKNNVEELTLEEAKDLYNSLHEIFGDKHHPLYPWTIIKDTEDEKENPYKPYVPPRTWPAQPITTPWWVGDEFPSYPQVGDFPPYYGNHTICRNGQ